MRFALQPGRMGFDWLILGLVWLYVLGGYLLVRGDPGGPPATEPLLTPGALLLYAGSLPAIVLLVIAATSGRSGAGGWREAIPQAYHAALVGAVLFAVGLLLELLFTVEPAGSAVVEGLVSPGTLLLAAGGALIASGPLVSFGQRRRGNDGGPRLGAIGLALATGALLAIPTLLVSVTHPWVTGAGATSTASLGVPVHTELYALSLERPVSTRLTSTPDEDEIHPAVQPDGTRMAVARRVLGDTDAWLLSIDGSDVSRVTDTPGAVEDGFTWSPDGERLAWWSDVVAPAGPASEASGASPLAEPAPPPRPDSPAGPPSMEEDHLVDIWVAAADGSRPGRIALPATDEGVEAWSPDGTRLCGWRLVDDQVDVHTFAVDGTEAQRVTDDPAEDWSCSWSPAGDRLVFHSLRDGDYEVISTALDGSDTRQLTTNDAMDMLPRWSPDGRSIAFISDTTGEVEVFVMDPDGGNVRNISADPALDDGIYGIDWTPDGKTIIAASAGRAYPAAVETATPGALLAIALESAVIMLVLGVALRFRPAPGTFTVALGATGLLVTLVSLEPGFIVAFLASGIVGDVLAAWVTRRPGMGRVAVLGFGVPAVLMAMTFLALAVASGLEWAAQLMVGAVLLAGLVGAASAVIAGPEGPDDSDAPTRPGAPATPPTGAA